MVEESEAGEDAVDGRWIYLGWRKVDDSGRVTIPASRYELSQGDVIHLTVETDDASFLVPDLPIESQNRVTIPDNQRHIHGVEIGERIEVTMQKTGLRLGGE